MRTMIEATRAINKRGKVLRLVSGVHGEGLSVTKTIKSKVVAAIVVGVVMLMP